MEGRNLPEMQQEWQVKQEVMLREEQQEEILKEGQRKKRSSGYLGRNRKEDEGRRGGSICTS